MARHRYLRVSSLAQDYDQQNHCINEYFARVGIDPASIDSTVVEKISGTVKHTERKLAQLLEKCKEGDVVYVSEMSRLGRNMSDLFAIVTECCERGISLVQCKDGSTIENKSIGGKALLFALGLAAEIEVQNIRQRTRMGLDVRRQWLEKDGAFVSKSGKVCTHFGRTKGVNLDVARAASTKTKQDNAVAWRENSVGYKWVRKQLQNGMDRREIIRQFNELHELDPKNYCTPKGSPLSEFTLSKWSQEMAPILIV